ncbi:MAG: SBBP repeat-containing protein [Bacteroidia bacterium]
MRSEITLSLFCLFIPAFVFSQLSIDWASNFGGDHNGRGLSIKSDDAGNIYTSGYFEGTFDFDPGPGTYNMVSHGSYDAFITKQSPTGALIWVKTLGGLYEDVPLSMDVDEAGNIFVTGFYSDTVDFDPGPGITQLCSGGWSHQEVFVCKFTNAGHLFWAKTFESPGGTNHGVCLKIDSSDNIYLTGSYAGTTNLEPSTPGFDVSGGTIFICKIDSTGMTQWVKTFEGLGSGSTTPYSLTLDPDGNVYTTGTLSGTIDFDPGPGTANESSGAVYFDIYVSKLDNNGNFKWVKKFDNTDQAFPYSIAADGNGSVVTAGVFVGDIDLDPGPLGDHHTGTSGSAQNFFLSKLDLNGNFQWGKGISSSIGDLIGQAVVIDSAYNIYATGSIWGSADFDTGPGTDMCTSSGDFDVFVSKFDGWGNFQWVRAIGDPGPKRSMAGNMSVKNGKLYLTGYFNNDCDFDTDTTTYLLTSSLGTYDIFSAQYDCPVITGTTLANNNLSALIVPNPSDGYFSLKLKTLSSGDFNLSIYSIEGKLLEQFKAEFRNENSPAFDVSGLCNGVYFVVIDADRSKALKLVISR